MPPLDELDGTVRLTEVPIVADPRVPPGAIATLHAAMDAMARFTAAVSDPYCYAINLPGSAVLRRLVERLTPVQIETWVVSGYLDVLGSQSRMTYRILHGTSGNIYRLPDSLRFCVQHPNYHAPIEVHVLCQFVLLSVNERLFLEQANCLGVVASVPGGRAGCGCDTCCRRRDRLRVVAQQMYEQARVRGAS